MIPIEDIIGASLVMGFFANIWLCWLFGRLMAETRAALKAGVVMALIVTGILVLALNGAALTFGLYAATKYHWFSDWWWTSDTWLIICTVMWAITAGDSYRRGTQKQVTGDEPKSKA